MASIAFSPSKSRIILTIVAGSLLALSACGHEDPSVGQIAAAEREISALTADGTFSTIAGDYRRRKLNELSAEMENIAADSERFKGAAQSIAARAKSGVAALDGQLAVAADAQLATHLSSLRAALNTFTLQKSIAAANSGAGTRDLIKTLQTSLDENTKSANTAKAAVSQIEAAAASLDSKAKALTSQANAKRSEASSMTARNQGVSATEGLEILKQAAAVRGEADAIEQQASEVNTALTLTNSELARARGAVDALASQARQLQDDIARANTRLTEEQTLAASATAAADKAAADLTARYGEFKTFRSATLDAAHSAAVTSAQKAVQLGKLAGNSGVKDPQGLNAGNTARISTALLEQNYADALASQARTNQNIAGTLDLLASAQPALPNATELSSAAAEARKSADDTLTQARELYAKVKEDLDKIGDEKLKGRIAETSRLLESLSSKQGIAAPQPEAATPAGDANPEVAQIKRLLDTYHDKVRAKDFNAILDISHFNSEKERKSGEQMIGVVQTLMAFDAACKDKLKISGSEALGQAGGMADGLTAGLTADESMTSADYTITVNGDTAIATNKDGKAEKLVKKEGRWGLATEELAQAGAMMGMMAPMFDAIKQVTADINSGKITDAAQVQSALKAKLGPMGLPGLGGGGGEDPNK